jgi:hypothetical protein
VECKPKIITCDIDLTKSDHPTFNPQGRVYSQVFPAAPGHTIESVQFAAATQNKATDPTVVIAPDKSSMWPVL